jgi:NAD(P)-dependent dehydrogenase (short-subunit alcohol dehydrogenase family)
MPGILVTGASTGIGEACVLHLASLGHRVFAGVRKPADGERLRDEGGPSIVPVMLDVTDGAAIEEAVAFVERELGTVRLAGLVNNAGVARGGPLEFLPIDEWREQLEVNVVGQVAVTQAFMPLLRAGHGRVVFIGSIGGRVGQPLMGPYNASKFALEGIAEAFRHEVEPFGMKVVLVEPGAVNTPIWGKGQQTMARLVDDAPPEMVEQYEPMMQKMAAALEKNDGGGVEPIVVAKVVERALFAGHPKPRYLVGPDAKVAGHVMRFVPDRLRDTVVRTFA